MLKRGQEIFDCQVVELLAENDVYQSYLVDCPDSTTAKRLFLFPDPLFDQKQRQAFFDHVDWLSCQAFPRIGSPLKAGDIEGQPACLYPSPLGVPLLQTLGESFSVRESVELIKKIAECLSVPHSAGFLHGNLSPDTIYLDGDSPYLADFSLNQLIRLNYHSGINPQYTNPEQVRGESLGTAADIYNLGCIFYRLLTGQPPFSGANAFTIAKQHLPGGFPRLPKELSLFQPLLDSLVKIVAGERIVVDKLIDQLTKLLALEEIDQLQLPVPADDPQPDDFDSSEGVSLFEEAMSSYEVATRIEARIKNHANDFQETAPSEMPLGEENDVTDGLDHVDREEKKGFGRFVLVLLLGVVIGSGLYFLFYKQSSVVPPVVVEENEDTVDIMLAELDQGLQLWQAEDYNGAETEFKRIIAEYPEDPRAYNNLAAFYAAQGNYDQARDYLDLALATDENYAAVYQNLGSVYAEMARGSYGRALQLDKAQSLISLPVFSSQGVVNLKTMTEGILAMQELSSEEVSTPPQLSEAGRQIAAEAVIMDDSSDVSPIVVVQEDPLPVVAEKEDVQLEKEEQQVVVAEVEPPGGNEPIDTVTVVLKQDNAESFLHRWAQAWSNQDVDDYLTFYDEHFIPPTGKKRATWEAQRRTRLTAPKKITVSLDNFQITLQDNNRVQIEVIQSYKSDIFADRTRKLFDLQATEGGWKIIREQSIGILR